jgi:hypothetical protein
MKCQKEMKKIYETISPSSSAEVSNAWSYTSTPPVRFHGVVQGHLYLVVECFGLWILNEVYRVEGLILFH